MQSFMSYLHFFIHSYYICCNHWNRRPCFCFFDPHFLEEPLIKGWPCFFFNFRLKDPLLNELENDWESIRFKKGSHDQWGFKVIDWNKLWEGSRICKRYGSHSLNHLVSFELQRLTICFTLSERSRNNSFISQIWHRTISRSSTMIVKGKKIDY